jgi:tetratricopeptide (TPR) repeat protein
MLLCGLVTGLVLQGVTANGWTRWDDDVYVTDNPLIRDLPARLGDLLSTPVAGNFHPVTMLSLALDHGLAGLSAAAYHRTNLILHLLDTLLVFVFVLLLSGQRIRVAFVCALLFGIHPMHVESVAWVSERKDVLYALFFLGGLSAYVRYVDSGRRSWMVTCFALFLLSVLSKPAAVVFPVVLLLIDHLRKRPWRGSLIVEKTPFLVVSVAMGIVTLETQAAERAIKELAGIGLLQRLVLASYGLLLYVEKLVLPVDLSAIYPYPELGQGLPAFVYLGPLFVIALGATAWFFRRRDRAITFAILFFVLNLALVLQVVPVGEAIIADRYTYVPAIGLFFLVGHLLDRLLSAHRDRQTLGYLGAGSVLLFAGWCAQLSHERVAVWKDDESLFGDVIARFPGRVAAAYNNRGNAYCEQGQLELALADYDLGIALKPDDPEGYINRGSLQRQTGRLEEALADYAKALELDPNDDRAYENRGNVYFAQQRDELALADYDRALRLAPDDQHVYPNRGAALARLGRIDEAYADLDLAVQTDPLNPAGYRNRAVLNGLQGRNERAALDWEQYLALVPADDAAYFALGQLRQSLNQHQAAVDALGRAIALQDGIGEYHAARSESYAALGNRQAALADALRAMELGVQLEAGYLQALQGPEGSPGR